MNSGTRHAWIVPTSDFRPPASDLRLPILIPATITIAPCGLCQLRLIALNPHGKSGPGPVRNRTAS